MFEVVIGCKFLAAGHELLGWVAVSSLDDIISLSFLLYCYSRTCFYLWRHSCLKKFQSRKNAHFLWVSKKNMGYNSRVVVSISGRNMHDCTETSKKKMVKTTPNGWMDQFMRWLHHFVEWKGQVDRSCQMVCVKESWVLKWMEMDPNPWEWRQTASILSRSLYIDRVPSFFHLLLKANFSY